MEVVLLAEPLSAERREVDKPSAVWTIGTSSLPFQCLCARELPFL